MGCAPRGSPFRFGTLDIARDWAFVSEVVPCHLVEDTTGIIALDQANKYVAAIVIDSWTNTSVQVHSYIGNPHVLRHGYAEAVFSAIFVHAGKRVVFGTVPANNAKALKFNAHVGFTEVCRLKDGFDFGVDYVLMEMRRENCRWIDRRYRDG